MRITLASVALAGLLAACGGDRDREIPTITLAPPVDSFTTAYTDITAAAWLGGDRWAVLAPQHEAVSVVDFASKRLTPFGGRRATEYRNPFGLFRAGDSVYLADWSRQRLTAWSLAGQFGSSLPAAEQARGALPRARDAAGRYYLEISPPPRRDGSGNRDSAVVVRLTPGHVGLDTLLKLSPLDLAEVQGDGGRRFERRIFSGEDEWGVAEDGSVWVARVFTYRVHWRAPDGTWRDGEALPDQILTVTETDRDWFIQRFPPALRTTAERLPFAAVKPPFEWALTGPGPTVWLERSRPATDSIRTYQVVDRAGQLSRLVQFQGWGRILAVAPDRVLLTEPTVDGMRLLQIPLPPPDGPGPTP